MPIEANTHLSGGEYSLRPARVPLSAYLDSPTTGKPWPSSSHSNSHSNAALNTGPAPRSISGEWWEHVCPQEKQHHVNTTEVNALLGLDMATAEGSVIIEKWAGYLRQLDHGCVNIDWGTPRIIDYE